LKQTYHPNYHIVNNVFYIFNNVLSTENNMKIKIFDSIQLKERAYELFQNFEALPNFLKETLTILIGNFHVTNEKNDDLNRENFKYVINQLNSVKFSSQKFSYFYSTILIRNLSSKLTKITSGKIH